jgi:hypothetical protein
VKADIELIRIEDINRAYERVVNKDVCYRFVIDMAFLKAGDNRVHDIWKDGNETARRYVHLAFSVRFGWLACSDRCGEN